MTHTLDSVRRLARTVVAGLLVVAVGTLAGGALAGCADPAGGGSDGTLNAGAVAQQVPLSKEQREDLGDVLVVDIISVYPSDAGLGRVYGQVTNLGEAPFSAAEFELVAEKSGTEKSSTTFRPVGMVRVTGLEPGKSVTFDVIGTVGVEEMQQLRADLVAVQ